MNSNILSQNPLLRLLAVFFLLIVFIGAAGYAFFDHLKTAGKTDTIKHLASTGKLRAGYLAAFLNERRGDARLLSEVLSAGLDQDWWQTKDRALPAALQSLKTALASYGYTGALILDAKADVSFSAGRSVGLSDAGKRNALRVLNQAAPVFSDLYLADPAAPENFMLDTFAPIMSRDGGRAVGVLVMRGNWDQLFTLTQPWPDQSRTAEYLLARKDGDDVLFLNQLRHQQQAAPKLRVPLSGDERSPAWPAIHAVQGYYGALESVDYRGKLVLAYSLPVPGTDWSMVVKVDAEEALADVQRLEKITFIAALAFILFAFAMLWGWLGRRSRAELALQRERDFAANLVETAPAIIVMLDLEGRIQHVNPYFEKLTGYRLDEVRGKDWFETFLPERDRERIRALFGTAAHGVPTFGNVNPIVTRRDEEREIEWHDQATRDAQGNIVSVLAIGQDVTVRVQAQNIERESQRRLQNILNSMFAFVGLYTPEGVLIEANRAPLDAAGLKRQDVIGKPFWDTYWWSYSPETQEHVRNALLRAAQGEIVRDDFLVRVAEDKFIVMDIMFGPLRDETGRVTQTIGSGVDVSNRKLAEKALKDSEEQFRATFEQAAVGVAHVGLNGQWLRVNSRLCELVGYSREELLALTFQDITHRDDLEADLGYVNQLLAGEIPTYSMEKRYLHKNGNTVWVNLTVSLVRSPAGEPRHFISIVEDISSRKLVEQALRTSEERLNEAQRIAQVGSWELDLVANKLTWSDEIFRIFEIDKTKFGATYEAFLNAIHPEDLKAVNAAYTGSLVTRKPYDITHRLRMADGRIKYVHERCESEFDAEDKPLRSMGTVQDITERKLADEALAESHRLLQAIINTSPVRIFWKDKELRYLGCNPAFAKDAGEARPDDLIGKNDYQLSWKAQAELYRADDRLIMDSGIPKLSYEEPQTTPDGHYIWLRTSKVPLRNKEHETIGVLGIYEDITESKHAEEEILKLNTELEQRVRERTSELQSANKELETFTYSVAHDLKAPLRGIDGYSRLLLADYADKLDDEGRGFLQNVRRATQQMDQLINDLLAYSRLERRDMQMEQLNLQALIGALLAERVDDISSRGVAATVAVPCTSVTADREGLTMALRNLLENALKFTCNVAQPMIELSGHDTGTTCILSVRDNGVGFDMKYHDRIFDIFQRLHRSEDYPGTGVGLAIVRKAMQRMGGRTWAESEPGKGATFYLEIPKWP